MKLSLEWIKDYVDLPDTLGPTELGHDLTMATVEVEDVIVFADLLDKIVVGVITEIKPHPDADQLSVCSVDVGAGEAQDIVCGGSNIAEGMKVAIALVGSKVRWHGEGELVQLKPTKIRGVQSDGMICASTEIGLGDIFPLTSEKEILDLNAFDITAGQPLVDALDLNDIILDIDNKSLTNRPDLWGHYGVARELAALYDLELKPLPTFSFDDTGNLTVEIESSEKCRRYSATQIDGVAVEDSPFWIRSRLARVGQRPINLLVDLTNYVMFSLGQPCHAFDSKRVSGTISVRDGVPGEKIELLDGTELEPSKDDLLIADSEGGIALAGVMGGARSSVFDDTTNVILEFAHFEAIGIRRTASNYVRTESSTRFEKSLDPAMVSNGVAMFIDLLQTIQKDVKITGHADAFPSPVEPKPIEVTTEFLHWRLGRAIEEDTIIGLFRRLGFAVSANAGALTVTPPTWRSTGDVSLPEDLVEEVARLYGYEEFEFVAPKIDLEAAIDQPRFQILRNIKRFLAKSAGMYEVMNYPWVHERFLDATGFDKEKCLMLDASPSPEEKYVQPSLVPQMVRAALDNLRYQKEFRLFEMNRVFERENFQSLNGSGDELPVQPKMLAGVFVGKEAKDLFLDAKGVLEGLTSVLPVRSLQFLPTDSVSWAPTNMQMAIRADGQEIGKLGVLSSAGLRKAQIKHANVVLFEINLDTFGTKEKKGRKFEALPKYEHVDYDLSFVFDENVSWQDIQKTIKNASKLIQSISFIEEYRGKNIPDGKKSIALRATLGSAKETLTSEKIDEAANSMIKRLTEKLKGELRS